jgi:hypothetical protein
MNADFKNILIRVICVNPRRRCNLLASNITREQLP